MAQSLINPWSSYIPVMKSIRIQKDFRNRSILSESMISARVCLTSDEINLEIVFYINFKRILKDNIPVSSLQQFL